MKISFSTLACPNWTLSQVVEMASTAGYDGIELRFLEGEDALWKLPGFAGAQLPVSKRMLADRGLSVPCVDTSCRFHSPDLRERERWIVEGERMADLAACLDSPGIRVFGDTIQPGTDRSSTRSWIADSIERLAAKIEGKGTEVWIETHGDFATSAETTAILGETGCSKVGVVWDPANGFMAAKERPGEALAALRNALRHVHIKDLRRLDDQCLNDPCLNQPWEPALTGEGMFPVLEVRSALRQLQYDRFLSFEWEKKWHPTIPKPEIALPHFVRWFRNN
jgi:sugar phosphate isomerase/epimerase